MPEKLTSLPKTPRSLTKSGKRMYKALAKSLFERDSLWDSHPDIIKRFVEDITEILQYRKDFKKSRVAQMKAEYNKGLFKVRAVLLKQAEIAFDLTEEELFELGIKIPKPIK